MSTAGRRRYHPRVRRPRDRDFLETREGLLFCVVGYVHPPERYVAYLKYTPAATGKWARGAVAYRRELPYYHVRHVRRTLDWLATAHPEYLWTDPATGLHFSHVPARAVARCPPSTASRRWTFVTVR